MNDCITNVLPRLKNVRATGDDQWAASCPVTANHAHGDRNPSLTVGLGEKGVVLNCMCGCSAADIVAAIGLELKDLFYGDRKEAPVAQKPKPSFATSQQVVDAIVAGMKKKGYTWVKSSRYKLPDGRNALTVMRFDSPDSKSFRPYHQGDDGRWRIGDPPGQLPLYNLPELIDVDEAWIVEGEGCADAMVKLGLVATTSAHGSKSPRRTNWSPGGGKRVNIIPDLDPPGEAYAETVGGILLGLGCEVRIVRLPGLKQKGDDIEQWLELRDCTDSESIVAELRALAAAAEPLKGNDRPEPEVQHDGQPPPADDDELEPVLVRMDQVEPKEITWLWHNRIALGSLTLGCGLPEAGKGFVMRDLAARISAGRPFPLEDEPQKPGGVLLICCEDDVEQTVAPHFIRSGANLKNIMTLGMLRRKKSGLPVFVDLGEHLPLLYKAIRQVPNPRLVIIDPLGAYLGKTNTNAHGDVYSILAPLIPLAKEFGVAVVLNHHLNKSRKESAGERLMGSQAFNGVCRNSWFVMRDPEDPRRGFGSKRLLLHGKSSIGPKQFGFRFSIEDPPHVEWHHEPVKLTADDAFAKDASSDVKGDTAVGKAKDFITSVLSERGEVLDKDLKAEAEAAGHSAASYRRGKRELGVEVITHREDGKVKSCKIKLRVQHQGDQDDWTNR